MEIVPDERTRRRKVLNSMRINSLVFVPTALLFCGLVEKAT